MDDLILPKKFHDPVMLLEQYKTEPEEAVIARGEKRALALFHAMADRVPAYKDFLAKNHLNPDSIKTIHDFKNIPTIDKDNYLRQYPLESLCWDGNLKGERWTISATSGSTGEPFYFPRTILQDQQYAATAEAYLLNNFQIDKQSTLYIDGFPMGVWIGGVFTYEAIRIVAERRKYALSVITPGISKLEIIKSVKKLGENFDQIIIGSYAPFLKDILDDGIEYGLDWSKYNIKFIFSAEAFSETFRDFVIEKAKLSSIYLDTLNHYGTVDLGTMAHETSLSILTRRLAIANNELFEDIFHNIIKLPTLAQYDPELFFFEEKDGKLICSAFSGLPLIRYDLKDNGGIYTYSQIMNKLRKHNKNTFNQINEYGINDSIWHLPFVYVYERSDFSISFFAFQIYPETIRKAIQTKEFEHSITGKFTMMVIYNRQNNQELQIHIELKNSIKPGDELRNKLTSAIRDNLLIENSEYRKTTDENSEKTIPNIILWKYEDETHFKPGIKQKWVKKNDK